MYMANYRFNQPKPSEITPQGVWQERRKILAASALLTSGLAFPFASSRAQNVALPAQPNPQFMSVEKLTSRVDATTYNNFYEFGMSKSDPERYAGAMATDPWSVRIEGEVSKPGSISLEQIMALAPMQERVYRLRCVEGWSMVIPWVGFELSALINHVQPTTKAKYVEFITDMQPKVMPGLASSVIDWPYREGLRIDEAMHPLTLLTFGMYGEILPNQNGAPVRIVVPWKYGFKSAKSIISIRFTGDQPVSSWMQSAPSEYGFYANVNPQVSHPRWSQATERRIGEGGLFAPRRKTLMFNGYGDQVASLYSGMDLAKNY
jgi:methionine sulfoxide reductase catalytic subunit